MRVGPQPALDGVGSVAQRDGNGEPARAEGGALQGEVHYKDGKRDGPVKVYYESGQLMVEANYKDGKREGIAKKYYETGQLMVEENHKNGVMISQKRYESDGKLVSDKDYPTE